MQPFHTPTATTAAERSRVYEQCLGDLHEVKVPLLSAMLCIEFARTAGNLTMQFSGTAMMAVDFGMYAHIWAKIVNGQLRLVPTFRDGKRKAGAGEGQGVLAGRAAL